MNRLQPDENKRYGIQCHLLQKINRITQNKHQNRDKTSQTQNKTLRPYYELDISMESSSLDSSSSSNSSVDVEFCT